MFLILMKRAEGGAVLLGLDCTVTVDIATTSVIFILIPDNKLTS